MELVSNRTCVTWESYLSTSELQIFFHWNKTENDISLPSSCRGVHLYKLAGTGLHIGTQEMVAKGMLRLVVMILFAI